MIKPITVILFLFAFPLSGWCNYSLMMSTLENYEPPSVSRLAPAVTGNGQKIHGDDASFDPQQKSVSRDTGISLNGPDRGAVQSIDVITLQGVSIPRKSEEKIPFFVMPASLATTLSDVDRDEDKAVFLLKKKISPELLAAMVLLRYPGIARARDLVDAQIASYSQVEDLDLVLAQYAAFTKGLMNGVGSSRGSSSSEMGFPFPGVTALKAQVVAQSVAAAREALTMVERNAVTDVQKAFWDLVYLASAQEITRETLVLFKNLHEVADSLYRSGKTGFQDVTRVTVKIYILEEALLTLEEKEKNIQAVILSLLNLPPKTFLGPLAKVTPSRVVPKIEILYAMAHQNRQELKQLRAVIGKMERMVELAETMILPGFDLGLSRYREAAIVQVGSEAMTPSFAENIPSSMGKGLPKKIWYSTGASWLMETRKRLAAAREGLRGMEADTRKMVRMAWYEMDRAVRRSRLYGEKVVSLSATALDVSTREYESGKIAFADVAGAYSDWLQTRLEHARALSDIGISRAQLARVTGTGS